MHAVLPPATPSAFERSVVDRAAREAAAVAQLATAGTTPPAAPPARTSAPEAGATGDQPDRGWDSGPGFDQRKLIFAVHDGEVVAVVTDQHGVVVRTVPPEELEAVRRAQARAGILVDVQA